jgi:dephospho-CoA kinase
VELLFLGWNPPGASHFWNDPRDKLRRDLTRVLEGLGWLRDGEDLLGLFRRRRFYFVHAVRCWTKAEFGWEVPGLIENCAHGLLEPELKRLNPRTICALGEVPHRALRAIWPEAIPDVVAYRQGWVGTVAGIQIILTAFPNWPSNRQATASALAASISRPFLLVGLTGGIASGKSTVTRQLAALGCRVIDADVLARQVVAPGEPALAAVAAEFGPEVLRPDGTLDRPRLGAVVFADPARRRALEAIVHPAVQARRQAILDGLAAEGFDGLGVQDAALLVEVGGAAHVDRLVVVYAEPAAQRERLMRRDGLAGPDADRRIASQMPLAEKVKVAHYVIDNSDSPEETEAQVRAVHAALVAEQRARRRP